MNKFEKFEYINKLEEEKSSLEIKLKLINDKLREEEKECHHIFLTTKSEMYPSWTDNHHCLLCNQKIQDFNNKITYLDVTNFFPKDDNYLTRHIYKFIYFREIIQEILFNNPKISHEELINTLNNLIKNSKSIEKKERGYVSKTDKQFVKTKNNKKIK